MHLVDNCGKMVILDKLLPKLKQNGQLCKIFRWMDYFVMMMIWILFLRGGETRRWHVCWKLPFAYNARGILYVQVDAPYLWCVLCLSVLMLFAWPVRKKADVPWFLCGAMDVFQGRLVVLGNCRASVRVCTYWGFPTRMVYLYYISCLGYTILVQNAWFMS